MSDRTKVITREDLRYRVMKLEKGGIEVLDESGNHGTIVHRNHTNMYKVDVDRRGFSVDSIDKAVDAVIDLLARKRMATTRENFDREVDDYFKDR